MRITDTIFVFLFIISSTVSATPVSYFYTDFNSGVPIEFSGITSLYSVEGYNDNGAFSGEFLGNPSFPPQRTTLTLSGLPTHETIELNFLLAIIDSWDAAHPTYGPDLYNVTIDGNLIFSETFIGPSQGSFSHQSFDPSNLTDARIAFGNFGFNNEWQDVGYDMGMVSSIFDNILHNSDTLTIEWFANGAGWQGGYDEAWAIDNVEVIVIPASVPEPTSLSLIGISLAMLFLRKRQITR
jgi:hypothetical protein